MNYPNTISSNILPTIYLFLLSWYHHLWQQLQCYSCPWDPSPQPFLFIKYIPQNSKRETARWCTLMYAQFTIIFNIFTEWTSAHSSTCVEIRNHIRLDTCFSHLCLLHPKLLIAWLSILMKVYGMSTNVINNSSSKLSKEMC